MTNNSSNTTLNQPSIIDMANAAYSMVPASNNDNDNNSRSLDDRLDAARAILGISPSSVADSSVASLMGPNSKNFGGRGNTTMTLKPSYTLSSPSSFVLQEATTTRGSSIVSEESNDNSIIHRGVVRRPRSDSAGLDALAFLATQEQEAAAAAAAAAGCQEKEPAEGRHRNRQQVTFSKPLVMTSAVSSSSDDDSETMPPPPPRKGAIQSTTPTAAPSPRRRSVSNPEGMEKWAVAREDNDDDEYSYYSSQRTLRLVLPASILEEELAEANAAMKAKEETNAAAAAALSNANNSASATSTMPLQAVDDNQKEEDEDDDQDLDHDELLRRARSRLLEDLSEGNLNGEKGVITLPHSLAKYKEVYNKNGRIGIYTPAERAAIIARFQSKRSRRVWNKKIRYNCRKNLADRRLRIKGRFVKRSTLEKQEETTRMVVTVMAATASTTISSIPEGVEATDHDEVDDNSDDVDMPDVSDPDAGFCPTDDQPYRRLRRHTIT